MLYRHVFFLAAFGGTLLAAPAGRAQAPADTGDLQTRLEALQRASRVVDEEREELGDRLARLDELADSLSVEIATASSAVRTARYGPATATPARTGTAATVYAGPDWSAIRLGLVPGQSDIGVLGRVSDGVSEFYLVHFGGRSGYIPAASVEYSPALAARFGAGDGMVTNGTTSGTASGVSAGSPATGPVATPSEAVFRPASSPSAPPPAPPATHSHATETAGGGGGVASQDMSHVVLVGSRNREVYHLPTCRFAANIAPENFVTYESEAAALADGRRPCRVCHRE